MPIFATVKSIDLYLAECRIRFARRATPSLSLDWSEGWLANWPATPASYLYLYIDLCRYIYTYTYYPMSLPTVCYHHMYIHETGSAVEKFNCARTQRKYPYSINHWPCQSPMRCPSPKYFRKSLSLDHLLRPNLSVQESRQPLFYGCFGIK